MKHLKIQKRIFRSGSDSGISCDDSMSSPTNASEENSTVTMESAVFEDENFGLGKLINNELLNKETTSSIVRNVFTKVDVDQSLDLVENIRNKFKSRIHSKRVKSLKQTINRSLPLNLNKESINCKDTENSTLVTKCLIENKDEWNKYLLGKSKISKQKSQSNSSYVQKDSSLVNKTCESVSENNIDNISETSKNFLNTQNNTKMSTQKKKFKINKNVHNTQCSSEKSDKKSNSCNSTQKLKIKLSPANTIVSNSSTCSVEEPDEVESNSFAILTRTKSARIRNLNKRPCYNDIENTNNYKEIDETRPESNFNFQHKKRRKKHSEETNVESCSTSKINDLKIVSNDIINFKNQKSVTTEKEKIDSPNCKIKHFTPKTTKLKLNETIVSLQNEISIEDEIINNHNSEINMNDVIKNAKKDKRKSRFQNYSETDLNESRMLTRLHNFMKQNSESNEAQLNHLEDTSNDIHKLPVCKNKSKTEEEKINTIEDTCFPDISGLNVESNESLIYPDITHKISNYLPRTRSKNKLENESHKVQIKSVEEKPTCQNSEIGNSNNDLSMTTFTSSNNSYNMDENINTNQFNIVEQLISNLDNESNNFSDITPYCSLDNVINKRLNSGNEQRKNDENISENSLDNWEDLRNKYSDILKCDLSPNVKLTRLSKNDLISKQTNNNNNPVKNKKIVNSTETTEINILQSPPGNNYLSKINPLKLRNVVIVLKDIKHTNCKVSKQLKLNRNFNICTRQSHIKIPFQYKYTNNVTKLTSNDSIFCGVQLMEGFKFNLEKLRKIVSNDKKENVSTKIINTVKDTHSDKPKIIKLETLLNSRCLSKKIFDNINTEHNKLEDNFANTSNKNITETDKIGDTEILEEIITSETPLNSRYLRKKLSFDNIKTEHNKLEDTSNKDITETDKKGDTEIMEDIIRSKTLLNSKNLKKKIDNINKSANTSNKTITKTDQIRYTEILKEKKLIPKRKESEKTKEKLKLDNKTDNISKIISATINEKNKTFSNKIEDLKNIKEVFKKKVEEIHLLKDVDLKNKSKLIATITKTKSRETDNSEIESIAVIEEFVKEGMKDTKKSISNNNEKCAHKNKNIDIKKDEKKKDLSKINIADKQSTVKNSSQVSSSCQKKLNTASKPKHIFKIIDETVIKRPPTRMPRNQKLNQSTTTHIFKVPQLFISPSNKKATNISTKKEFESPKSLSPKNIKKNEKEYDLISIYAETLETGSIKNGSDFEPDLDKYNMPGTEVNFTKVNKWLNDIDQNSNECNEKSNKELPVEENMKNDNEKIDNMITNEFVEDLYEPTTFKNDLETFEINNEENCTLQNSINHHNVCNVNRCILTLRNICNGIKFRGDCLKPRCKFEHNLATIRKELPDLTTNELFVLYNTMKKNAYFSLYKLLFSDITDCLGSKRDFNKLISMVKDVLEINLNSVRAPFIKNIIDALCSTGVAFHSMVEVVYKNANVSERLMTLLRDILLNITVEQKKSNESWAIVKEIINNKKYDLDLGIIKSFIIETFENESSTKELCYKIYNDVLRIISDSKLALLAESLLHNFYYILMKNNYRNEAKEFCARCFKLNINIGPNSDSNSVFSSPENIKQSSQNITVISNTSIVSDSPLQVKPTFKKSNVLSVAGISKNLNSPYYIDSVPNISSTSITNISFNKPPPLLPSQKTDIYTALPHQVNKLPVSNQYTNLYRNTPVFNSNPIQSKASVTASVLPNNYSYSAPVRSNNLSNLYTTSVKPRCSGLPTNILKSGFPNYTLCNAISSITSEVNQAIFEKNVMKIHTLIIRHKDTDFTDKFVKIIITSLLESDIDIIWFFQELYNTAKCVSTLEDKPLSYVLKTIGLNIVLNFTKNQEWTHATKLSNFLRSNFQEIYNVKTYLDETYTYIKRILIFARIHIKNNECLKAWTLISDTFPNDSCHIETNEIEESFRNFVIDELLNVINITKMWNVGLRILKFVIEKSVTGVDIKKRASEVLIHAINSKCGMVYIMEFVKHSQNWYNYVSKYVFRSIVAYAVSENFWQEAKEFYSIGCTCEIYPQIFGNERCMTISSQHVLEEIWLMFDIFLRKRYELGPIKNNVIIKILEVPSIVPMEEIPNNLRQYKMDALVMRARIANVLNNYIKPSIKIVLERNYIILKEDDINNHIYSKIVNSCV